MDNQTMAQGSKAVGRTVEVAKDIPSNKLEGMIGADAYADFPSSTTMSYDTFSKRASAVADALGLKDTVKG